MQDWNLQDWKMTDEVAGVEFAGLENDGVEQEQTYAFKVKPVLFEGIVWSTALTPTSNDTG